MFNFTESAKKALDVFASATGLRLFPDPLKHPGGEDVCTLDLPGYRQLESYTCGFVAGAMILHTFRPGASLKTFFDECSPDYDTGLQAALGQPCPCGRTLPVLENLSWRPAGSA